MNILFASIIALIAPTLIYNEPVDFALPKEWTRDFTIELYTGGGMQDKSTTITFSYDSIKTVEKIRDVKKAKAYALTAALRTEILTKLRALKVDELRSVETSITMDAESTSMCFHYKTEFCLTEGSATALRKGDEKNFSEAYRYLSNFATRK